MYRKMGILSFILITLVDLQGAYAATSASVGVIEELFGSVQVTRRGEVLGTIDMGEPIENYDLIKTGSDGSVVISLTQGTGMTGTLVVKPNSAFTVKSDVVQGKPTTEGDVLVGSVGVKVKKISGDPALRVRTGNTVMGVRGTEFEVVVSVNDSLLVACTEGRVACSADDGTEVDAVPGEAVERKTGEALRRIPVAVSSVKDFRDRWIADEITAFRASPVAALNQYAQAYNRMVAQFRQASAALEGEPVFTQWKREYKAGTTPSSRDVNVMKQKSVMVKKLMGVRQVLFLFERVYYRLDEIRSYVPASALNGTLSNGQQVDAFLRQVQGEQKDLARMAAQYRFALRLYADRNDGHEPVSVGEGDSGSGDSFFDSNDNFFN
jgi:hypothetical protein